ncbi:MAG: hypothetical protein CM1200mP1_10420 [Candidatus Neomarinimicrobiota bacterium]|nr:MAG: hypothetical protein CM1200mP1_10420 [Candidatus Neomarinimicrobiota bacterium]
MHDSRNKDQLKTSAKLIDHNLLEMAYDAPKRFFNDNYKSSIDISEKDLELYWGKTMVKNPISN